MEAKLIFIILGAMLVLEGLPYFMCPGMVKKFYRFIEATGENSLRSWGLLAIFVGFSLIVIFR